jgi:hypothetical protein
VAEVDDLARIQQAHHASLLAIRETSAGLVEDAWDAYAGLDDVSARRFTEAAARISTAAQQQTAALAAGYLEANDAVLGRASSIVPTLPPIRNGVPTEAVYNRSIVEARRIVGNGGNVDQALAAGRARATSTARTDVILANRGAVSAAKAGRPWVVGYRRVLTGKSCALCATASTQRYNIADLQPIHASCDCDVAEIYGNADPGQVINRELLEDLKATAADGGRPDYWRGPYLVDERGRITVARTDYLRGPDGKRLLTEAGNPVRVKVPGDPVRATVRRHGELGEVLTDSRHAFTAADEIADLELPSITGRPTAVADELDDVAEAVARTSSTVDDLARTPANIAEEALDEAPKHRLKPTDPRSNSVQREALRRNVSPERVAAERDAAKLARAQEQRALRQERKAWTRDSPEVIEVAARNGVDPDDVIAALERIPAVRKEIAEAAARTQAEAFDTLYSYNDAWKIQRPPPRGATYADGNPIPRAGWDFLEQLDARERARLSRQWYDDSPTYAPDLLQQTIASANPGVAGSVDEAVAHWLEITRRYEAAGALRRGKLPSERAYSGAIDPDNLVADVRYSVRAVLGSDDLNAAGHIAGRDAEDLAQDAYQYLGRASTNPQHGPSPYRMSYQSWEEEVRTLEYGLREYPSEMPANAWARYRELVPEFIDEPGLEFEDLYTRIVTTARQAGEEVPDYARIPWQ